MLIVAKFQFITSNTVFVLRPCGHFIIPFPKENSFISLNKHLGLVEVIQ